jgi:putative spermidine/putrescine transport system permease protein
MATIASAETNDKIGRVRSTGFRLPLAAISYLQAAPLFIILGIFFILPIAMIAVVSFWDYDFAGLYPAFLTMNYTDTLGSWVTWKTYLNTLKFTVIVWALTLFIGFWVA